MLLMCFVKLFQAALAASVCALLLSPVDLCFDQCQFDHFFPLVVLDFNDTSLLNASSEVPAFPQDQTSEELGSWFLPRKSTSAAKTETNAAEFSTPPPVETGTETKEQTTTSHVLADVEEDGPFSFDQSRTVEVVVPPNVINATNDTFDDVQGWPDNSLISDWSCVRVGLSARFCTQPSFNPRFPREFCLGLSLLLLPTLTSALLGVMFLVHLVRLWREQCVGHTLCRRCVNFGTVLLSLAAASLLAYLHFRWDQVGLVSFPCLWFAAHVISWVLFAVLLAEAYTADTSYDWLVYAERCAGNYSVTESKPSKISWGMYRRAKSEPRSHEMKGVGRASVQETEP